MRKDCKAQFGELGSSDAGNGSTASAAKSTPRKRKGAASETPSKSKGGRKGKGISEGGGEVDDDEASPIKKVEAEGGEGDEDAFI